jgi:phosphoribosylanthranilate isomerase
MRIQIYTVQSPDEAQAVTALGVDHVGVTPGQQGLPGEVDLSTARTIVEAIRGRVVSVALTVESDPESIEAMVRAVEPDILHLCGLAGSLPPEAVCDLRTRLPDLPIMQAVSVMGPEAVDVALAYQEVVDYLILDTQAPDIPGIGASGETHDWAVSREIVRRVRVPVILAGGLSPENVAEAVCAVRPWGVDSLTHTNRPLPGGGFRKDLERVARFVSAARGADASIHASQNFEKTR